MPAPYRRRMLAHWWTTDDKPRGRMKSLIEGQNRAEARREIRQLQREADESHDDDEYSEELERAWMCHAYGICDTCPPKGEEDDELP